MSQFTYTGETAAGEAVTRTVEAEDRFAVYEIARQSGHTVKDINESSRFDIKQYLNVEKIEYAISRVKDDELAMFTRNLGSMIKAGLSLTRALSVLERQTTNPRLKGVLKSVREDINKGTPFSESLGKFPKVFDDLYVAMVRAGEESGKMADVQLMLATQIERSVALRKKIKGAMIYPGIVISVMTLIGVLMMIYVMPSITETFEGMDVEIPAITQALINISNFMVANTLLTLGGLVGGVVGFIYLLKTKYGHIAFSWLVVRLPVIGTIAKEANAARTARTLSSLLSSGVDVLRALSITKDVLQNPFYKDIVVTAVARVEKGDPLSKTFIEREDLYPILVGEMISVGEETGQISQLMEQLADFYETEVENKTKDLSTIIEPIMMVVVGGGVGLFALAVITPIYSITDSI